MARIKEDYVSFEIAKLLKERGFDEPCKVWYAEYTSVWDGDRKYINIQFDNTNRFDESYKFLCYAPTLQMAMKWLREVHGVTIVIDTNDIWLGEDNRFYWCKIYYKMGNRIEIKWYNDPSKPKDILRYQTYEEACEEAIKYCLENLI